MPELPEVETVRVSLERTLKGKTIASVDLRRADLRAPFPSGFAEAISGKKIEKIERRAKYLLVFLNAGAVWIAHLGMSGRFEALTQPPKTLKKHDHVLINFTDGSALVYHDPRRFGLMDLGERKTLAGHKLLRHLGQEPLEADFSTTNFAAALRKRKAPIKQVLMDAGVIVGVGNIYAGEALFRAGIDPRKPAQAVAKQAKRIADGVRKVLEDAIASGGSSLRDFVHVDGDLGRFQHHFQVYGRAGKPCYRCRTPIQRLTQAGRTTYFCPSCQR